MARFKNLMLAAGLVFGAMMVAGTSNVEAGGCYRPVYKVYRPVPIYKPCYRPYYAPAYKVILPTPRCYAPTFYGYGYGY